MSAATFTLSKPDGDEQIPLGMQAFVSEKLKNDLYDLVMREFKNSGISQSDLAVRLGKDKALLSRQLSTPSNWTIDTVAKMLFAINGSLLVLATMNADAPALANYTQPSWLQGRMPPFQVPVEGQTNVIATFTPATVNQEALNMIGSKPEPKQYVPYIKAIAE